MTDTEWSKDMSIAEQLRAAIEASGTAYRAAKDSGVDVTIVQRFLNGERDLRLATAARLCEALGLELRPIDKPTTKPAPKRKR